MARSSTGNPRARRDRATASGSQAVLRLLENLRSVIRACIQFTFGLLQKARFAKPKLNGYERDHHDRAKAQSDNLSQRHGRYSTDGAGSFLLLLSQIGRKSRLGADSAGPSAGDRSRAAKSLKAASQGRAPPAPGDVVMSTTRASSWSDGERSGVVFGRGWFQIGGLEHASEDSPGTGTKEEPPAQEKAPREELEHGASGGRRLGG